MSNDNHKAKRRARCYEEIVPERTTVEYPWMQSGTNHFGVFFSIKSILRVFITSVCVLFISIILSVCNPPTY